MFKKFQNSFLNNRFIFRDPEKPAATSEKGQDESERARAAIQEQGDNQAALGQLGESTAQSIAEIQKPGKIQSTYLEKLTAIPEETAEKDRETLKKSDIKSIRFNTRLLKTKVEGEDEITQATSIKEETEKRIKAYTDKIDKNWCTLNYERLGSDKNGHSHETFIGLGDIILDPDIKDILVKKSDGTITKAHRGVVPEHQNHAGRQAFLDEHNEYVVTHSGDSFRLLNDDETDFKKPEALKKYLDEFSAEEKNRAENAKDFDNETKEMEDQDLYYRDTNIDPKNSVAEQLKDNKIKLNSSQKEMAGIIEREFKTAGLDQPNLIAAAIVNAYMESRLNPNADGRKNKKPEDSLGLFQLYAKGWGEGMGEERFDPVINTRKIIEAVKSNRGNTLRARAAAGATATELTAIFCRDIEVPAHRFVIMKDRAKVALNLFGERVVDNDNEIAENIDNGKEGYNGKGIIKLRSEQDSWIFGSSGVVAMNNLKNNLDLGKTGFFGIVGINPMKFKEKLETEWPKISKLKLPKQIILEGMAVNSLGKEDNPELVQKNIDAYVALKEFLESKGTKVKIATVQPSEGMGEQVSKFNDKLREKYGTDSDTLIDIAKQTTSADGKHLNSEYASTDGIHLSRRGYEKLATMIKESANS